MSKANWAIVIGIDQYWKASACLAGAVKDALRMRQWLLDPKGGQVPAIHLHLLLALSPSSALPQDLEYVPANSDGIIDIIKDIARRNKGTARGERLFFYYAGHGLTARINFSNESALVPADFTPDHPDKALRLRSLVEYLEATHIPEQFFFIDGCRNIPWEGEFQSVTCHGLRSWIRIPAPQQFIFYATSPGDKAAEIGRPQMSEGLSPMPLCAAYMETEKPSSGTIRPRHTWLRLIASLTSSPRRSLKSSRRRLVTACP